MFSHCFAVIPCLLVPFPNDFLLWRSSCQTEFHRIKSPPTPPRSYRTTSIFRVFHVFLVFRPAFTSKDYGTRGERSCQSSSIFYDTKFALFARRVSEVDVPERLSSYLQQRTQRQIRTDRQQISQSLPVVRECETVLNLKSTDHQGLGLIGPRQDQLVRNGTDRGESTRRK